MTSLADPATPTAGTLRDAISQANIDAGNGISDTINFDLSLAGGTIMLMQGQLELKGVGAGTTTIDGSGLSTPLAVSGNNASRVFQVDSGVAAVFNDLTIENGNSGSNSGGGILNNGTLTLTNSTVTGNSAAGAGGGGIENFLGTMTVTNTVITGNSTGLIDGGMENFGTLTMTNTTVSNNSTPFAGGGLGNYGNATVTGSTFSGNIVTFTGSARAAALSRTLPAS